MTGPTKPRPSAARRKQKRKVRGDLLLVRSNNDSRRSADVQAIWDTVSLIPRGQVSTYGAIARAAGLPGRARLTGYALRVAPKELYLPWHRVVGAGGRIVFPKSSSEFKEQSKRLRAEKTLVSNGRVDAIYIATLGQL